MNEILRDASFRGFCSCFGASGPPSDRFSGDIVASGMIFRSPKRLHDHGGVSVSSETPASRVGAFLGSKIDQRSTKKRGGFNVSRHFAMGTMPKPKPKLCWCWCWCLCRCWFWGWCAGGNDNGGGGDGGGDGDDDDDGDDGDGDGDGDGDSMMVKSTNNWGTSWIDF